MENEAKKVVLITGGAMGQGRAHAVKYAENGFNVVLADMLDPDDSRFKETIKTLNDMGAEVLAMKANITSTPDMEKLFAAAWEKFGRLDVVIANAGVINFGYTWELTDEQVEKVLSIDLEGTWRTDKYAVQYMLKQALDESSTSPPPAVFTELLSLQPTVWQNGVFSVLPRLLPRRSALRASS